MLRIKQGVRVTGISREIWYAIGVAASLYWDLAKTHCVVTAGTDGTHNPGSKHYQGEAVDLRTNTVPATVLDLLVLTLKERLEPLGFDVCLERSKGATPATTAAHIHIEFDPKHGEQFLYETA